RAFPYGGLDLARLFDSDQDVAANVGGIPPASFGMLVRDVSGRTVLASQTGRRAVDRGVTPLRLTNAPLGVNASASIAPGVAFAGPFTDLRATGTASVRAVGVRVSHRFTPRFIQTRWDVLRRAGNARYSADALFPSWGRGQPRVVAVLRDGSRVTVGDALLPL